MPHFTNFLVGRRRFAVRTRRFKRKERTRIRSHLSSLRKDLVTSATPRTTRHTTHHHLDGYPDRVTVVRDRHPFEGQTLELLGWSHRHGSLYLLLVLPDGTRSLIPAN